MPFPLFHFEHAIVRVFFRLLLCVKATRKIALRGFYHLLEGF